MDSSLLRTILGSNIAFRSEENVYTLEDGFAAVVHVSRDSFGASLVRVTSLKVADNLVVITSTAEGPTTTYVEPASIAAVTVREEARTGDRKRPGFV